MARPLSARAEALLCLIDIQIAATRGAEAITEGEKREVPLNCFALIDSYAKRAAGKIEVLDSLTTRGKRHAHK